MALKIALFVVLCIAQGLAMPPVKSELPEPYEIPNEFEEAVQELDYFRVTLSVSAFSAYVSGTETKVIIGCFREQKMNFLTVGRQIALLLRNASMEMAEELGENFEEFRKRGEIPLRIISVTIKRLPSKVWNFIKIEEFGKAMGVMRLSGRAIGENAKILGEIVADIAEEFPEAAMKAEERARQIRVVAKEGFAAIAEAFGNCIEEGPKKPYSGLSF